jgi:hypothetical protein
VVQHGDDQLVGLQAGIKEASRLVQLCDTARHCVNIARNHALLGVYAAVAICSVHMPYIVIDQIDVPGDRCCSSDSVRSSCGRLQNHALELDERH